MPRLAVLDSTLQKTHEWLRDVRAELGLDDDQAAYVALRATLHALRDCLNTDETAQLGAQLPMLVRGLYYEGWDPSPAARRIRNLESFLDAVRHGIHEHIERRDAEHVAVAVLGVIGRYLSLDEIAKVARALPPEMHDLWENGTSPGAP